MYVNVWAGLKVEPKSAWLARIRERRQQLAAVTQRQRDINRVAHSGLADEFERGVLVRVRGVGEGATTQDIRAVMQVN